MVLRRETFIELFQYQDNDYYSQHAKHEADDGKGSLRFVFVFLHDLPVTRRTACQNLCGSDVVLFLQKQTDFHLI